MDAQGSLRLSTRLIALATIWFAFSAGLLEILTRAVLPATGYFGFQQHLSFARFRVLTGALIADFVVMALLAGAVWVMNRLRPSWFGVGTLSGVLALPGFYAALKPLSIMSVNAVRTLVLGLSVILYRAVRKHPERWAAFAQRSIAWLGAGVCGVLLVAFWGMGIAEKIDLATTPPPAASAPNVLLIILDTFRADRTGAYGYDRGTTPFLDEFARQSIQYDRAFSTSSWTLPAHVSAFTGRRPGEHGAELVSYDGRFETIAHALAGKGYETTGISANRYYATYSLGVGLGFLHYENTFLDWRDAMEVATLAASGKRFLRRMGAKIDLDSLNLSAEDVNRRFLNWMDHRPNRPFFAFLNYMDTHFPRRPRAEFARKFPDAAQPITEDDWYRLSFLGETPSAEMAERLQDNYDGSVAYLDSQLRNLFQELERRGLENNLLVIITSDHGESLGEHNLYDHRNSLYLEQVRIPLLMRFPGRLPKGIHITQAVSLRQVAATIASFAGLPEGRFPGPALPASEAHTKAQTEPIERTANLAGGQFEGFDSRVPAYQGWVRSVFSNDWHFILQEDGKMELYDWVRDPGELHNLANSTDPEMVARFKEKLLGLSSANPVEEKR